MSDYKELIEELKFLSGLVPEQMCDEDGKDVCEKAAYAIETLLAERDEFLGVLRGSCSYCVYADNKIGEKSCNNCFYSVRYSGTPDIHLGLSDNWKWRGIGGNDA